MTGNASASEFQTVLDESRRSLFASVRGLSEEQFRHAPDGDAWSIAAHLAHLLRIERVFAERAAAALNEEEPFIKSTRVLNDDDPALAQHLAVPQIMHGLQASRRDLLHVLDQRDDSVLERAVMHERLGRMTIAQIMRKMADHEREHTEEIERLVKLAPSARPVVIPLTPRG